MTFLIIGAGIILIILILSKRSSIDKAKKTGAHYHFYTLTLEFLVPLVAIVFFYSALAAFVSRSGDSASLAYLIQLETTLTQVKSYLTILKLDAVQILGVLAFLYLLGLLGLSSSSSKGFFSFLKGYRIWTRRIFVPLVILSSLTLFGTQLGEPTNDLQLRIKTIRDGYADVRQEIKELVDHDTGSLLYSNAKDSLPPSYLGALAMSDEIADEIDALDSDYEAAKAEYGLNIPEIQAIIASSAGRREAESKQTHTIKLVAGSGLSSRGRAEQADKITYRKLINMKRTVSSLKRGLSSKKISLLSTEGGSELLFQVPRVLTGEFKKALFQSWIDSYPILEPLVDVLKGTVNKKIESEAEVATDRVLNLAIKDPSKTEALIEQEARKIADGNSVTVASEITENAETNRIRVENQLGKVKDARAQVKQQVQIAENKMVSGSEMLFAYSSSCSYCRSQQNIISEFEQSHPEVRVTRRSYYTLSGGANSIESARGHPQMIFRNKGHVRKVIGKTELSDLKQEYVEFKNQIRGRGSGGSNEVTSGGGTCG